MTKQKPADLYNITLSLQQIFNIVQTELDKLNASVNSHSTPLSPQRLQSIKALGDTLITLRKQLLQQNDEELQHFITMDDAEFDAVLEQLIRDRQKAKELKDSLKDTK